MLHYNRHFIVCLFQLKKVSNKVMCGKNENKIGSLIKFKCP